MAGFLDLEDYITEWATQMFDVLKSKDEGKIPKEHLDFQINWTKIRFQHGKFILFVFFLFLMVDRPKVCTELDTQVCGGVIEVPYTVWRFCFFFPSLTQRMSNILPPSNHGQV